MSKAKVKEFLRKHWVSVWLVLSLISLTVFFVAAEYITNHNRAKRVIAVTSSKAQLFSSDRLELLAGDSPDKKWYSVEDKVTENEDGFYKVPVHIWNFDPANPKALFEGTLNYTLTAELVNGENEPILQENMNYSVTENGETETRTLTLKLQDKDETTGNTSTITLKPSDWSGSDTATETKHYEKTHTLSKTITIGGTEYSNKEHTVTLFFDVALLDEANLNDVRIKLTATPNGHQELTTLSAIIGIKEVTHAPPSGWKGHLQETSSLNTYNGFNYTISGYGEDDLTLYFRSDLLELNYWSYTSDSSVGTPVDIDNTDRTQYPNKFTTGSWKKTTIDADSETKSRYIFQFYLKKNTGDTYTTVENEYIYFPNNDTVDEDD